MSAKTALYEFDYDIVSDGETLSVLVEVYDYKPGTPSRTYGPPELCYTGDPDEMSWSIFDEDGKQIDSDTIPSRDVENIEERISEYFDKLDDDDGYDPNYDL